MAANVKVGDTVRWEYVETVRGKPRTTVVTGTVLATNQGPRGEDWGRLRVACDNGETATIQPSEVEVIQ